MIGYSQLFAIVDINHVLMVVWGDLHTGDSKLAVEYLRGLASGCSDI